MSKLKTHKGTLKRVKITGRKKVKYKAGGANHLMSHMSGDKVRKLRKARYAKKGDMRRLRQMLHIRVIPGDAEPPRAQGGPDHAE